MNIQTKKRKNECDVDSPAPRLRIVDAQDLDTGGDGANRFKNRSALVQHFIGMADQIDAEIEKILKM